MGTPTHRSEFDSRKKRTWARVGVAAAAAAMAAAGTMTAGAAPAEALPGYDDDAFYLPFHSGYSYEVTQSPGDGYSHSDAYNQYAWDFAMNTGEPVYTAKGGEVTIAGPTQYNGTEVRVDHGNNVCSHYIHLSGVNVNVGDSIDLGTKVGEAGQTGNADGSHLHYSVVECDTGIGIPSEFVEGHPQTGEVVTAL